MDQASLAGGVDWEKLKGLSGDLAPNLAEHWQVSRVFLEKALELWPRRLERLGVVVHGAAILEPSLPAAA